MVNIINLDIEKRSCIGHTAQWESARPNLDLPKIEARSEVSAFLQNANPLRFG